MHLSHRLVLISCFILHNTKSGINLILLERFISFCNEDDKPSTSFIAQLHELQTLKILILCDLFTAVVELHLPSFIDFLFTRSTLMIMIKRILGLIL